MIPEQPWPLLEARLYAKIPPAKAEAVRGLRNPADRNATLVGLLLLRSVRAALGRPCDLSALEFPPHGKPRLPDGEDFSISHGGARVACAATRVGRIGLDVEPEGRLARAALRLIADAEEISRVDCGEYTPTGIAVAKESAVKALGGTYAELGEVRLAGDDAVWRGVRLNLTRPDLGAGHIAVLADSERRGPVVARALSFDELAGWLP